MKCHLKHPLLVGAVCEAADANGTWWKVTVVDINGDSTYRCEVDDGPKTIWDAVSPDNMKPTPAQEKQAEQLEQDLETAEKSKDEARCVEIEALQDTVLRGGVPPFKKGDAVDVKHNIDDDWKPATICSLGPIMVDTGYSVNRYQHIRHSTTALRHPLAVGDSCEALDANGTWWPVSVSKVLSATSYSVSVDDGANTVWPEVISTNMRKSNPKKIERERSKEKSSNSVSGKKKKGSDSDASDKRDKKSKKKKKDSSDKKKKDKKHRKKSSQKKDRANSDNSSDDGSPRRKEKDRDRDRGDHSHSHGHHHHHHHHAGDPVKGDVVTFPLQRSNNAVEVVTGVVVSKGACKLTTGEQVAVPPKVPKMHAGWFPLGSVRQAEAVVADKKASGSIEGTHPPAPTSPSASSPPPPPPLLVLHRDPSGGSSRPSLCTLSLDLPPDTPDTLFQFTLRQQCRLKKCDPPQSSHEPGPLTIGLHHVRPPAAQQQQQQPLPACIDGWKDTSFRDTYYFTTSKAGDDRESDKASVVARGDSASALPLPSLKADASLTLIVSRAYGRALWVCGGDIKETRFLPRDGVLRPFVGLSRGHTLALVWAAQAPGKTFPVNVAYLAHKLSQDPWYSLPVPGLQQPPSYEQLEFAQRVAYALPAYARNREASSVMLTILAGVVYARRASHPSEFPRASRPIGGGCCSQQ